MRHFEPETEDRRLETTGQNFGSPKSRSEKEFMVKVCGITNLQDALLSVKAGANTLGFNFYPKSPRFIRPEDAAEIIRQLPGKTLNVGVVVVASPAKSRSETVLQSLDKAGVGAVQIHGASCDAEVPDFRMRTFIATSPERANSFPRHEIIVDTSWGTGTLADWDLISNVVARPYILSGGLTPENVCEALSKLSPDGVDVCSGVEKSPGKKDPVKLERFLSKVRSFSYDS